MLRVCNQLEVDCTRTHLSLQQVLSCVLSLAQSSYSGLPSPGVPVRPSHSYTFPQELSLSCMKATLEFWRRVSVFCFSSSSSWDTQISLFSTASPRPSLLPPVAQHIHTQGCHRKVNEDFETCVRKLPNTSATTQTYLFQNKKATPAYHRLCGKKLTIYRIGFTFKYCIS